EARRYRAQERVLVDDNRSSPRSEVISVRDGGSGGRGGNAAALVGDRHRNREGALVRVGVQGAADDEVSWSVSGDGPGRGGVVAPEDRGREVTGRGIQERHDLGVGKGRKVRRVDRSAFVA